MLPGDGIARRGIYQKPVNVPVLVDEVLYGASTGRNTINSSGGEKPGLAVCPGEAWFFITLDGVTRFLNLYGVLMAISRTQIRLLGR
jgi:hypothetical protein